MQSEAHFLTQYGKAESAFERRTFGLPEIKTNEIIIEVEAFGLNYAEVMARRKLYKAAPPLPCILGYEVLGKIIEVGKEISTNYLGKRVVAFTRFGGYAKHVIASSATCVEIGDLEQTKALSLATQYVTAYYMSEYLAPIHTEEKVLIHAAAGGVGTALIQLCKQKGAIVFAKVSSEKKGDYVKSLGADFAINYITKEYESEVLNLNQGKKIDVIFNPVAGSTFKKDLNLLASGGKLHLFGGSELLAGRFGFFSQLNFLRKMGLNLPIGLMMRSRNILGTNMLKIADEKPEVLTHCLTQVVKLCLENKIAPPQGTVFEANQITEAHALLESGKSIGKIAVRW